jgi:DHA1 family bicyclomycin/chloramphenicol resistance-like MFS transporter
MEAGLSVHCRARTESPDGHRTLPLIVALGFITAFDAMAIDLYLPAVRDIGRSFGANPGTMQTSLAVFVGVGAIGQLSEEE